MKMIKVLTFGTYDIFHPGHEHHLKKSKDYGDELFVVIARDETVKIVKGKYPKNNEQKRLKVIENLPFVTKVFLGNLGDKYKIVEEINPDIICLGYDQNSFTEKLPEELEKRNIKSKIIKFEKGHKPHIYKSSKMK